MRRLPVYVLVDCSESMAGPSVASVQEGLRTLIAQLQRNPYALDTVFLSVIVFGHKARQLFPLTEIASVVPPVLAVQPGTALGEAFALLGECMRREVRKQTEHEKGDFRPLVFLITDGQPTDEWRDAVAGLADLHPRPANIYAIGCGEEVDFQTLGAMTDCVFHMQDMSPELFAKLFIWMSASIQASSEAVSGFSDHAIALPPPEGCVRLHGEDREKGRDPGARRQIFLHVRCAETGRPFLLRYVLDEERGAYLARGAHALDESFFPEGGSVQEAVPTASLWGSMPCPHCGNPGWIHCGHGKHFFCAPDDVSERLVCPLCGVDLMLSTDENGQVGSSLG